MITQTNITKQYDNAKYRLAKFHNYEDAIDCVQFYCIKSNFQDLGKIIKHGRNFLSDKISYSSFASKQTICEDKQLNGNSFQDIYIALLRPLIFALIEYTEHMQQNVANKENFLNRVTTSVWEDYHVNVAMEKMSVVLNHITHVVLPSLAFYELSTSVKLFVNNYLYKWSQLHQRGESSFAKFCCRVFRSYQYQLPTIEGTIAALVDSKLSSFTLVGYSINNFKSLLAEIIQLLNKPAFAHIRKITYYVSQSQTTEYDHIYTIPDLPEVNLHSFAVELVEPLIYIEEGQFKFLPVELTAVMLILKSLSTILNSDYGTMSEDEFLRSENASTLWLTFDNSLQVMINIFKQFYKNTINQSRLINFFKEAKTKHGFQDMRAKLTSRGNAFGASLVLRKEGSNCNTLFKKYFSSVIKNWGPLCPIN